MGGGSTHTSHPPYEVTRARVLLAQSRGRGKVDIPAPAAASPRTLCSGMRASTQPWASSAQARADDHFLLPIPDR